MKTPLVVGILPEGKNIWEQRAPLTPEDVRWLKGQKVSVEIISSPLRIFPDSEYKKAGAAVVRRFKKASLLIGIKEPPIADLEAGKVYMVFSHTTKGQKSNRSLLQKFLTKHITLIDYEHIADRSGLRLTYFGRFAGICGIIDALHILGERLQVQGLSTPFLHLQNSLGCGSYEKAKHELLKISRQIQTQGLNKKLSPFIVGITGRGNVAQGVSEVLDSLKAIEIHPKDILKFVRNRSGEKKSIYKIVFNREEKLRAKNREGFYFEEYLKYPGRFESNLDRYLPHLNLLVHCSYWDKRFPRLVPEKMVRRLYRQKNFRLNLIADLSCDVKGAIEITKKTTTPDKPAFVYNPKTGQIHDGHQGSGICVTAVDNLPCEFPEESSKEFSSHIRDYVYQIASHSRRDVTNHHALPIEIREAVITQSGKFTPKFRHLKKYI